MRRTAAVVTVASFGHLPDLARCKAFEARTGIPVIVDAAGCSDALLSGAVNSLEGATLALSFHATKAFGIGEGGAVATTDASLAHDIRTITNFGLDANRVARLPGINAKMSEYTAAVGLALLDHWPEFRIRYNSVLASYRKHFAAIHNTGRFWLEPNWITTYPHVITRSEIRTGSADASPEGCADRQPTLVDGRLPQHAGLRERPAPSASQHRQVGREPSSACRFRSTSTMRRSAISPARRYRSCRMPRARRRSHGPGGPCVSDDKSLEIIQQKLHSEVRSVARIPARKHDLLLDVSNGRLEVWAKHFADTEPELLDFIDAIPDDAVYYDIGASIGHFALYAAMRIKRVIALEPEALNFATASLNHFLNRDKIAGDFTLLNLAASEAVAVEHLAINLYGAGEHTKALQRTGRSEGASERAPDASPAAGSDLSARRVDQQIRASGTHASQDRRRRGGGFGFNGSSTMSRKPRSETGFHRA